LHHLFFAGKFSITFKHFLHNGLKMAVDFPQQAQTIFGLLIN